MSHKCKRDLNLVFQAWAIGSELCAEKPEASEFANRFISTAIGNICLDHGVDAVLKQAEQVLYELSDEADGSLSELYAEWFVWLCNSIDNDNYRALIVKTAAKIAAIEE